MTSSNDGEKRDLSIVKGNWETIANNYFYLVFENGDEVKLERLEYQNKIVVISMYKFEKDMKVLYD